jgi:hypothetical protein
VADGAQVDRLKLAEFVDRRVRQRLSRSLVALAAEIELPGFKLEPEFPGGNVEHLHALGNDFGTRAVAGDDGNFVGLGHANFLFVCAAARPPGSRPASGVKSALL